MLKNTHKYNIEYFKKYTNFYIFATIRNRSADVSKGPKGSTVHAFKLLSYNRYKYHTSEPYSLKRVSKFGDLTTYLIFHSYNTMYKVPPIDNLYESNIISFGELARRRNWSNVKI